MSTDPTSNHNAIKVSASIMLQICAYVRALFAILHVPDAWGHAGAEREYKFTNSIAGTRTPYRANPCGILAPVGIKVASVAIYERMLSINLSNAQELLYHFIYQYVSRLLYSQKQRLTNAG